MITFSAKIKRLIMNIVVMVIAIAASYYLFNNVNHKGYELIFVHPILFFIGFSLVFSKVLSKDISRLFIIVFTLVSFIRYVILPILVVYSGYYGGRSIIPPTEESYKLAINLMSYEFIFITIVIFIYEKKYKTLFNTFEKVVSIDNKNLGYYIFIVFSLLLLLIFPRALSQINIIFPRSIIFSQNLNTFENLALYSFMVSKNLVYIVLLKKIYLTYEKIEKEIFLLLSIALSVLNIFIYIGSNRTDILLTGLVTFITVKKLYGKKVFKYLIILGPIILILLSIVTESRNYISISDGDSTFVDLTDTFQVYAGGVYNVAIAIETVQYYPEVKSMGVLLMDILRPIIGLNVFVRTINIPFSNIFFNRRIRLNSNLVSQIIPMIGQGYIYFGSIFSVIFSLLFVRFSYYLEKIRLSTNSLEFFYFFSLVIARLGMIMGQNTMNLLNDMSMNLLLFLIVYQFNKWIKLK